MRDRAGEGSQTALGKALRYVSLRDRTEQEVRAHLLEKGCSPEAAEEALSRLRRWGYLDDARLAMSSARWRRDRSQWGPVRLARELKRRGVAAELVEETLRRVMEDSDEVALARKAAERYLTAHPGASGGPGMRRLAGYLGRRGYSGEVIARVVRERFAQPWDDTGG